MPSKKALEAMDLEELDAELAASEEAVMVAMGRKREVGAARQDLLTRLAAEATVTDLTDAEIAALAAVITRRQDAVATPNALTLRRGQSEGGR